MTITVYKVDNETRLFLPNSSWGNLVLQNLRHAGHTAVVCEDQTTDPDPRPLEEMQRMTILLHQFDQLGNMTKQGA